MIINIIVVISMLTSIIIKTGLHPREREEKNLLSCYSKHKQPVHIVFYFYREAEVGAFVGPSSSAEEELLECSSHAFFHSQVSGNRRNVAMFCNQLIEKGKANQKSKK